jgi:phosphotriesterase-related protein
MSEEMAGQTNTVLGSMPSSELGVVLPHEHIFIALTNWYMEDEEADPKDTQEPVSLQNLGYVRRRPYTNLDNLHLSNAEVQQREITEFRDAGGNTIVDLTLEAIGRNVSGLADVSKATGVNVIAGCGFYVHTAHPREMDKMTSRDVADIIVRDLIEGIEGTGIKAGVIGEIGTWDPIHPDEEKVLRGVAEAHRRTGAPIIVHTYLFAKWGLRVLDILEEEGVPPERVAVAHVDSIVSDLDYHKAMADRGAYVEYDLFGAEGGNDDWREQDRGIRFIPPIPCDMERILAVKELCEAGYGDQLLISQDVCMKVSLSSYGGHGYAHIQRSALPLMLDLGIPDGQIQNLVQANPQRFLGWTRPAG